MMFDFSPKIAGVLAAALLVGTVAGGAQAATVTYIAHSTQGAGNQAHVFAPTFAANTPAGATWDVDPTVATPPLTVLKDYKSPFLNTPLGDTQTYFAADAKKAVNGNGVTTPAKLTYSTAQKALEMVWGSVDTYNKIAFFYMGTPVFTWTGEDIAADLGLTANKKLPKQYEEVVRLKFTDFGADGFDSIRFTSGQPAFEFALPAAVPVPAAGLLLLSALGGVAALRRRKAI